MVSVSRHVYKSLSGCFQQETLIGTAGTAGQDNGSFINGFP